MIKLFQRTLLQKASRTPFPLACSKYRQHLLHFGASSGTRVSLAPLSSINPASAGARLRTSPQKPRGSKESGPRLTDPIRHVSDKLLASLMKRHEERFALPETGNVATPKTENISGLSTEDLIHAIYRVPQTASHNIKADQLQNIEKLLTKCLYTMTLDEALQTCHGFYLQGHKFHRFLSCMLSVVDERFDDLSPSASEISRLMFYVFSHGNAPNLLLHRVEGHLLQNLDDFDINDLGVICVGFFRANSRLCSQDLLDAIAEKLLTDLSSLEPFLLLDILKTFRHSSYIRVSFYKRLGDFLIESDFISRYTTLNPIMHIAFTYASIPIQHTALMERLFSHAEELLHKQRSYFRTKDLSKFVWACGTLQFRPQDYERRYGGLVERFEAIARDNRDFPESIAEMLIGLVYLGIFPQGLLHRCLSPDVTARLMGSASHREKSFQMLLLNETVKIECPDYAGNLVSQSQVDALQRYPSVSRDLDKELQMRVGLQAVLTCLHTCLGFDRVHCLYPFIHFKTAVIELWHCRERGFLKVSPSPSKEHLVSPGQTKETFTQVPITDSLWSALTNNTGKTVAADVPSECKRLALVVTSSQQFALNANTQPLGHLHTVMRQLQKSDYTVLKILPEDALHLELSSHEERCRHLSAVLSSALQTTVSLS